MTAAAPTRKVRVSGRVAQRARAAAAAALLAEARACEAVAKGLLDELGAPQPPRRGPGAPAKLDHHARLQWRLVAARNATGRDDKERRKALRQAHAQLEQAESRCWAAVLRYDGMARHAAKAWGRARDSFDEEHQIAREGLFEAAKRYDPARGVLFGTYARWWVRARLMRLLPGHELTAHDAEDLRNLLKAEREGLNDAQIATRLGRTTEQISKIRDVAQRVRPLSLDLPLADGEGNENGEALGNVLAAPEPDERMTDPVDAARAGGALAQIDERRATVLRLRYGLVDGHEHTLEQVAERLDLSRERVRQIEREALYDVRARLGLVSLEEATTERLKRRCGGKWRRAARVRP